MNRTINKIIATLLLLSSCNSQTADQAPAKSATTDKEIHYPYPTNPDTLFRPEEWAFYEILFNTQWMKEYMKYIKNDFELYYQFTMPIIADTNSHNKVFERYIWDVWVPLFIDDNYTPELCFELPNCNADSELMLTNYKGKVDHTRYNGLLSILPHSGLCYASDAHMSVEWEIYYRIHEGTITPFMDYSHTDTHRDSASETYSHLSFVVYNGDTIYKRHDKGEYSKTRKRYKRRIDACNTVAYYHKQSSYFRHNTYRYYPMAVFVKYLKEL